MTSITLTDEQLDRLADALAGRIAARLVDRGLDGLDVPAIAPRLVDAAELARILGLARSTVYEHAEDLGAVRLGDGARARLRFDVETARAAISRSPSERSEAEDANGDGAFRTPAARSRRRDPAGLPKPGSLLPLEPAPRGRRRAAEQR